MSKYWPDGYRQDCSGFVSMAWNLGTNEWTGSLAKYGVRITKSKLQPGDILLFHNPANPEKGSHVTIFGGWQDAGRTRYLAYEQTPPGTRRQATPYAYWSNSSSYLPYRYKYLRTGTSEGASGKPSSGKPGAVPPFPGAAKFRPGQSNEYVTQLGKRLVKKGFGKYYTNGPGPRWSEADRRNVQAFQRAQGWRGKAADGYPGAETWRRLFS
ncbi:hypothetical protein GBW32_12765 [Streptomyces tsukubensis]|nr:hypothetical protein GBW32_12765 [Streptomyces tsukubensis]